mmetsp:Transcript_62099/g.184987  ORF Transcript_62099/g.184987 Transcript_62099/m.184987 type:complete len:215 (-) Transcript_62099:913-1557(-)
MAAPAPQVLRQLEGGWLECRDAQGVYYYNQLTQQTTEASPAAAVPQMPAVQAPQSFAAPAAQAPQQGAKVKHQVGVWTVAEDAQGEFYYNQQTGQAYTEPPPELLLLLMQAGGAAAGPAAAALAPPQGQPQYAVAPAYQYAAAPSAQGGAQPPQAVYAGSTPQQSYLPQQPGISQQGFMPQQTGRPQQGYLPQQGLPQQAGMPGHAQSYFAHRM